MNLHRRRQIHGGQDLSYYAVLSGLICCARIVLFAPPGDDYVRTSTDSVHFVEIVGMFAASVVDGASEI